MKIFLDGNEIEVDGSKTLLQICRERGIIIPTLCYHASLTTEARCRVCLVEMNGKLVTSCNTKPAEGAQIITNSQKVFKARKMNMELMVQNPSCKREDDFEVCNIYEQVGLGYSRFEPRTNYKPDLGAAVIRDNNKCTYCVNMLLSCAESTNHKKS
jgi:NADP-reducing hydrogenase subunit HndD